MSWNHVYDKAIAEGYSVQEAATFADALLDKREADGRDAEIGDRIADLPWDYEPEEEEAA